jgi:uncharacterized protein (DUF2235 family)
VKVGLLPKDNLQQVDFAYKAYKRTDKEGIKLAAGFKQTFSRDVKVEFVGVWYVSSRSQAIFCCLFAVRDTVQSTGMLVNRKLPFTDSNSAVKVFRHALSLDEVYPIQDRTWNPLDLCHLASFQIPARSVPLAHARY